MKPDEITKHLRPEEIPEYELIAKVVAKGIGERNDSSWKTTLKMFERLAECRRLIEKHQYSASGFMPGEDPYPLCPECRYDEHDGHAPDCGWQQAIDTGRK